MPPFAFNRMISRHFDLFTLCYSETAEAEGLLNLPTEPEILDNLSALATAILDPIVERLNLPVTVTSGYRGPALNQRIGGRSDSQHLSGEAADFLIGGVGCDVICGWITDNLPFDELILEKFDPAKSEFGWVHCSHSRAHNRGIISSFDGETYHDGLKFVGVRDDRLSSKVLERPIWRRLG
ncbi:MAG: hypothetical protein KTR21_10915 [Rhodobacteraceae bacterium]|nr:hypothetical protein [Paracoccaceae bacterium]